jgi:hypothetical protein
MSAFKLCSHCETIREPTKEFAILDFMCSNSKETVFKRNCDIALVLCLVIVV